MLDPDLAHAKQGYADYSPNGQICVGIWSPLPCRHAAHYDCAAASFSSSVLLQLMPHGIGHLA